MFPHPGRSVWHQLSGQWTHPTNPSLPKQPHSRFPSKRNFPKEKQEKRREGEQSVFARCRQSCDGCKEDHKRTGDPAASSGAAVLNWGSWDFSDNRNTSLSCCSLKNSHGLVHTCQRHESNTGWVQAYGSGGWATAWHHRQVRAQLGGSRRGAFPWVHQWVHFSCMFPGQMILSGWCGWGCAV